MALVKSQAKHDDLTVWETINEFVLDGRIRNLSPETAVFYKRRLTEFLEVWLDNQLVEVTIHDVREQIELYHERGYSPATINGYIRALKAMLNWALREDCDIATNSNALPTLKEPKRVMPHLKTQDEIVALLAQPDRRIFLGLRDLTMMLLMLDTGMRVRELVALDADDVQPLLLKVHGNGDKERMVSLTDHAQKVMMKYLRARHNYMRGVGCEGPFLFPSRNRRCMSIRGVTCNLKRYGEAAGITDISISPHKLRYTYATHHLRNGGDIVSLQQTLGYAMLAMTRHYAQMVDADVFEQSRKYSPISKLKL